MTGARRREVKRRGGLAASVSATLITWLQQAVILDQLASGQDTKQHGQWTALYNMNVGQLVRVAAIGQQSSVASSFCQFCLLDCWPPESQGLV